MSDSLSTSSSSSSATCLFPRGLDELLDFAGAGGAARTGGAAAAPL